METATSTKKNVEAFKITWEKTDIAFPYAAIKDGETTKSILNSDKERRIMGPIYPFWEQSQFIRV